MSEAETMLSVDNLKVYFDIKPEGAMLWTKPLRLKAVANRQGPTLH